MTFVDVGAVDDFPEGKISIVVADGKEVGVASWRGEWFALRNICPHLGAPVCTGAMWPLLTQPSVTDPDLTVEGDRPVLMCPWHRWEFDVRSGDAITGRERVKTYPVHIEDGRVVLDLSRTGAKQAAGSAAAE